ncbi:MAG: co-chaperone GroES [Firmicutes bacterium]|nr:co-chaperone GroES [Bacillota bacterium]
MKIKPLFDRIVIEQVDNEEKTKSGIVLLAKDQEKPIMAKVVAVGPGGLIDGVDVKMVIKKGDLVLYSKYAGSEFKIDGKEVTIIKQSDVLAVVE